MKSLIILLTFLPFLSNAQGMSDSGNSDTWIIIVLYLLGIGILIFLFYLFRNMMLWYWKIDIIVKNQEINNKLLDKMLTEIKKSNENN